MSALKLADIADRTALEPDGWSILVVEEARIGATTQALARALDSLLGEDGTGAARVFSERRTGPVLIEELTHLGPLDVALLPLPANVVEPLSRSLDYGRGRLIGRPRCVIVTSEAGVRQIASLAPHLWGWIGPRVFSPANEVRDGAEHRDQITREASQVSSRLVRVNGVLTIDPGVREGIPAEILDHRTGDDEHDNGKIRGGK